MSHFTPDDAHELDEEVFNGDDEWLHETIRSKKEELSSTPACLRNRTMFCELTELTHRQYKRHDDEEALESSIQFEQEAVAYISTGFQRAKCLLTLGDLLFLRFRRKKAARDMKDAIKAAKQHVYPYNGRPKVSSPTELALDPIFADLEESITISEEALELLPEDWSDRWIWLRSLTLAYFARFNETQDIEDIDKALKMCELGPEEDEYDPSCILIEGILTRFRAFGDISDCHDAVRLCKMALERDLGNPKRVSQCLAEAFYYLYYSTHSLEDLDESIKISRNLEPGGRHSVITRCQRFKSHVLYQRYLQTDNYPDLHESITSAAGVVHILQTPTPKSATSLFGILASHWVAKTGVFPNSTQLSEALEWSAYLPIFETSRIHSLQELAHRHYERYEKRGMLGDLEEVIRVLRTMEEMVPNATLRSQLGSRLKDLYLELRFPHFLTEATEIFRKLVEGSTEISDRMLYRSHLVGSLAFHHEWKGTTVELEEGIAIIIEMPNLSEDDGEGYRLQLDALVNLHYQKCRVERTLPNIEYAIKSLKQLSLSGSPSYARKASTQLVGALLWKYCITDDLEELNNALKMARQLEASLPNRYPNHHSIVRHRLAISLYEMHLRKPDVEHLEQAIELERKSLGPLHVTKHLSNANLASLLSELYSMTGQRKYLEESIEMSRDTERTDGRYHMCFTGLHRTVPRIFDDLENATMVAQLGDAVSSMESTDAGKAACLSTLALALDGGSYDDTTALQYARQALALISEDHQDYPWHACCLVLCLNTGLVLDGQKRTEPRLPVGVEAGVLQEMITLAEQSLKLSRPEDPGRPFYIATFSVALHRRFSRTGRSTDLNQAIRNCLTAYNLTYGDTTADLFNTYLCSYQLFICLQDKYLREGYPSDLEQSTELYQESERCKSKLRTGNLYLDCQQNPDESFRALHLGSNKEGSFRLANKSRVHAYLPDKLDCHPRIFALAKASFTYYLRSNDGTHIDQALGLCERAMECIGEEHIQYKHHLHLLGRIYERLYQRSRNTDADDQDKGDARHNLTMAISKFQELFGGLTQDDGLRYDVLSRLGKLLSDQLYHDWDIGDLKMAVEIHQECLNHAPEGSAEYAFWLIHLGRSKNLAYVHFGSQDGLDEALRLLEKAKRLELKDLVIKRSLVHNLAEAYRSRFKATSDLRDIITTVKTYRDAVDLFSGPLDRIKIMAWLGHAYLDKYQQTKVLDDSSSALSNLEGALKLHGDYTEDTIRSLILEGLIRCRLSRNRYTGVMDELEAAIAYALQASKTMHFGNPQFNNTSGLLGLCYATKFERTRSEDDILLSIEADQKDFWYSMSSPNVSNRLDIAQRLLKSYAKVKNWQEGFKVATYILESIPQYTPRYLSPSDAQSLLAKISGLASIAAAFSIEVGNAGQDTLHLLEQGRGVFADFLYDLRVDFNDRRFQNLNPNFKQKFKNTLDQLGNPANKEATLSERMAASKDFNELLYNFNTWQQKYRLGTENANFAVFTKVGPIVVINVSHRCDAFLIRNVTVDVLPLPDLSQSEIDRKLKSGHLGSTEILEWLWDTITGPILDKLGYTEEPAGEEWPQICWIPTGALSRFPLHAAGYHTDGSGDTVLDRVISSYSSSIKAIMEARLEANKPPSAKAVMVAMQNTPGSNASLPFAQSEISKVRDLCESMALKTIEPDRTSLQVLSELKDCQIFHFAGHGKTDETSPLKSELRLDDWQTQPLTVADLLNLNLRENPPFLAYLSACGTSRIRDQRLLDESLHLISACQLAGFRHVVGTLWEVEDEACVEVAETVYGQIRDDNMSEGSVGKGLHDAVIKLRNTWLQQGVTRDSGAKLGVREGRDIVACDDEEDGFRPALWAPYVYYTSR
ncbi:CHAT domain-containing protein [Fusarium flagelliforme]|uniref:CHAT domain-containing protein n=1 Tax=Fusarium flagelliforme TaxID=2675880 RepID=UPI001E8D8BFD|nr:CHAT domain-containing protein [Fusarium flagelliforme]KAH7196517.1 CHAT domain-containing protein [Fusarium flagelliforme]